MSRERQGRELQSFVAAQRLLFFLMADLQICFGSGYCQAALEYFTAKPLGAAPPGTVGRGKVKAGSYTTAVLHENILIRIIVLQMGSAPQNFYFIILMLTF